MGFNSVFKGLTNFYLCIIVITLTFVGAYHLVILFVVRTNGTIWLCHSRASLSHGIYRKSCTYCRISTDLYRATLKHKSQ